MCSDFFKCKTQKILLVEFMPQDYKDPEYKLLYTVYSKLTEHGYIIRATADFGTCTKCNNTILSKANCDKLKVEYSDVCEFYDEKLNKKS